ncbi:hypothetical protein IWQ61_010414, partial [Dispira simplex]
MRATQVSSIYRAIADVPFGVTLDFEFPRAVSLPFDYIMDTPSVSAIPKYDFSLERKILDQIEERRTREQLQALTVAEQKRLTEEKLQTLKAVTVSDLGSSGNMPKRTTLGAVSTTQPPISTILTSTTVNPAGRPGSVPPSSSPAPVATHGKPTSHLSAQSQDGLSPPTSFSEVNSRPSSHIGNFTSLAVTSGNNHPGSPTSGGYPPPGSSFPAHYPRPPVATSVPLGAPGSASVVTITSSSTAMTSSLPQLYPPTTITTTAASTSA